MAIAIGNTADLGDNGGASNSLTVAYNNAAVLRRTLLNIIGDFATSGVGFDDITGVTYAGVALSLVAKQVNLTGTPSNSARFSYIYTGYNLPTGTNNFVITCTNTHYILAVVADYAGSAATAGLDNSTTNRVTSGTVSLSTLTTSLTTIADNCWLALSLSFDVGGGVTPTGVALRKQGAAFGIPNLYDSNGSKTPAGNYSATTLTSSNQQEIAHILASLAPLLLVATAGRAGGENVATVRTGGGARLSW